MAMSKWMEKAYAAYDWEERRRKRRVNPDYPRAPGTGAGGPPNPPSGFQLLTGQDNQYLLGADGAYLYGKEA